MSATGAYEDVYKHYLSSNTYNYILRGSYFQNWLNTGAALTATFGTSDVIVNGVTLSSTVATVNISISNSMANSDIGGPFSITATNPDGRTSMVSSTFTISKLTLTNTYEDAPQHYLSAQKYDYIFQGTSFENWNDLGVKPNISFQNSDVSVTSVTYVSSTSLHASIVISAAVSNPGGPYNLKVTNPDGRYAVQTATFSIPIITVTNTYEDVPKHYLTAQKYDYIINGANFEKWSAINYTGIAFANGGANDIKVSSVTYIGPTQLRASVQIGSSLPGVTYDINATNPDGRVANVSSTFTIPVPTITSAYEDTAQHYLSRGKYDYIINGTGFENWSALTSSHAAVVFNNAGTGQTTDLTVTSTTWISSTQLRASIVVDSVTTGTKYDINVINPDGQSVATVLSSTFSVSSPTITGAYEDVPQHYLTARAYDYIINGKNFQAWTDVGSTVAITFTGGGVNDIRISSITYVSSSQLRASIVITTPTQNGATYSITATNPDGQTSTLSSTFTINAPAITGTFEDQYQRFLARRAYDYTLLGTNFAAWSTIPSSVTFLTAANVPTPDIAVTSVTWVNSGRVRASIVIANSVTGGPYKIRITNPSGSSFDTAATTFTISTPTITSSYEDVPQHYLTTKAYDYILNGSSFAAWGDVGSTVTVSFGSADITVTSVTYTNSNAIRASIVIGNSISGGTYTITATNPYGLFVQDVSTFTFSTITVTNVYENVAKHYLTSSKYDLIIRGSNFENWGVAVGSTTVSLLKSGAAQSEVTVTSTTYVNGTTLRASIVIGSIPNGSGTYDVKVANPDGRFVTIASTFIINAPAITVVSEDVSSHYLTSNMYDLIVTGTDFQAWPASTATITLRVGGGGGTQSEVSVASTTYVNATTLRASIVIGNIVSNGSYDVRVTNSDGRYAAQTNGYVVAAPVYTGAYEDTPMRFLSAKKYDVIVNGSNFENWGNNGQVQINLLKSGAAQSEVAVTSTTWVSGTQLRASLVVGSLPTVFNSGTYDIQIVNADTRSAVQASTEVLNQINVTSAYEDVPQRYLSTRKYDLIVNGLYFENWASNGTPAITLLKAGSPQTEVSVTSATYVSSTTLHASIAISSTSAISGGPYDVKVINPDTRYDTQPGTFTISAPALTGAYEDIPQHYLTAKKYDLIVNGAGFESWPGAANASVSLLLSGSPQSEITVTSTTYISSTQLRASIVFGNAISGGPYDISVTNPDGQTPPSILVATFSVSAPQISSAYEDSPQRYLSSKTFDYIINGGNFEKQQDVGAWTSIAFSGGGASDITVTSVTYVSASQLRASVVIANSVTPGANYNITATNPDGRAAVLSSTYAIAAPTINSAYEDTPKHYLTANSYDYILNGTNFARWTAVGSTVTVSFGSADVTVSSVTYLSPSQIRASLVIGNAISGGPYGITATNPYGLAVTLPSTFTVLAPALTNVYIVGVASGSAGIEPVIPEGTARPTRPLTVSGTGFENWTTRTASITLSGAGITVTSVTWSGATQFVANLAISTASAAGVYNVTVVNPDGRSSSAISSTFTVTVPTSAVTYPSVFVSVGGVNYSTGIASVNGTASYLPAGNQTALLPTQVRITRVGDGFVWNGTAFVDPASGFAAPQSENQWQNADSNGTTPWTYTGFGVANQISGQTYKIETRARTADNGWSMPGSPVLFQVDKSAPESASITNPLGGSLINNLANTAVSFNASDTGSKISKLEVYIADTNLTPSTADDFFWTGSSFSASAGNFIYLSTDATHTPIMQFSPPISPANGSFTGFTNLKVPTWQDGHQYRVGIRATDGLGQMSNPADSEITFYYDVSRPTITFLTPVISTDSLNPNWLNAVNTLTGTLTDNVNDSLNVNTIYVRVWQKDNNAFLKPTFTSYATNATQFEIGVSTNWIQINTTPGAGLWTRRS